MNLIEWGLEWFSQVRDKHCTETVTLVLSSGAKNIKASVIDPGAETNAAGVRSHTEKILFIVKTSDITIDDIKRGVRIIRPGRGTYESVIDKAARYYNDSYKNDYVIPAKLKCS